MDVIAVPDLMNIPVREHQGILEQFSVATCPLTQDFVNENGLTFWNDQRRTGWACGDYVLYRALSKKWDYAWIIEPDVYFLYEAISLLPKLSDSTTDLITTNFWRASNEWYWRKPLEDVMPGIDVHAMGFPLSRVSRSLAEKAFEFRQHVVSISNAGSRVPNDESILATTAFVNGFTTLDLKKQYPNIFTYWSTVLKYPISDIRSRESQAKIVHSGLEDKDFVHYISNLWDSIKKGNKKDHGRFLEVLNVCSTEVLKKTFANISSLELEEALNK
ncbi:hypothetical protein HF851_06715 [Corynebacterium ammoniagenes]|uniref:hypothetical protein n=1 Tax=Corynebacterium ammoniagenes TaxID=1697 RepID=UPI001459E695|nr:hypothetical protein [Corynebacterium ammoniagenes]NMF31969.1 hypothetical protein [Corynebacterium ammoniagenes]